MFAKPVYASGIDFLTLLPWRFGIGAGLAWLWLAADPGRRMSLRRLGALDVGVAVVLGLIYLGNSGTYFAAIQTVPASLAALIVYVYPALIVEHSFTDNIFHKRSLLHNLLNKKVFGFSFLEGTGCNGWLYLVGIKQPVIGIVVLVVFQFLEHRMAINLGRVPDQSPP